MVIATAAHAETLTLGAAADSYSTQALAASSDAFGLEMLVASTSERGSERWPPAAVVGISDGPDRRNSLQLFLVREGMSRVSVGLRMVLDGVEVKTQEIGALPAFGPATITLSFREGNASIQVNPNPPIRVTTPFDRAIPYVAVNSCTVRFDWKLGEKLGGQPPSVTTGWPAQRSRARA